MAKANGNLLASFNENHLDETEICALENLIDRRGIQLVLEEISDICGLKAGHIAEFWQDTATAHQWAMTAGAVSIASTKAKGL